MVERSVACIATKAYLSARNFVIAEGYSAEIAWQVRQLESGFNESDLLRESAWVVLCSGFRESLVRQKFDHISLCFCDWHSAEEILHWSLVCQSSALKIFRSERKMAFIADISRIVVRAGFEDLKRRISRSPLHELRRFPGIGRITVHHLAKNLGFPYAKEDRHLFRAARHLGYHGAEELCRSISDDCGDPVPVIDIVLWRYCTLRPAETLAGVD